MDDPAGVWDDAPRRCRPGEGGDLQVEAKGHLRKTGSVGDWESAKEDGAVGQA